MGGTVGGGPGPACPVVPPMAAPPPAPTMDELVAAIRAFPQATTLGSDRYHPRISLRLTPDLLKALLLICVLCELLAGEGHSHP